MAKGGKGGGKGSDSVGSASAELEVIVKFVADEASKAEALNLSGAGESFTDSGPVTERGGRGRGAARDVTSQNAGVAKMATVNGKVQLEIDTAFLKGQLDTFFRTYRATINLDVQGGEPAADQGAGGRGRVSDERPITERPPLPANLDKAYHPQLRQAVDNIYRSLATAFEAGGRSFGSQPKSMGNPATHVDKLADIVSAFGDDLESIIKTPTANRPQAILDFTNRLAGELGDAAKPALLSMANSLGPLVTPYNPGSKKDAVTLTELLQGVRSWAGSTVLSSPQSAPPQARDVAPSRPAPTPAAAPEARTSEQERARAAKEELVKAADEAREGIVAAGQRALSTRSIDVSAFATPPLGTQRKKRTGRIPSETEIAAMLAEYDAADAALKKLDDGLTAARGDTGGTGLTTSPGVVKMSPAQREERNRLFEAREQIGRRLDFVAYAEADRARGGFSGATVETAAYNPAGGVTGTGSASRRPSYTVGSTGQVTDAAAVGREDELRRQKMLSDWMMNRGLRGRGGTIDLTKFGLGSLDTEPYLRAAEAGYFTDVYEQFTKEDVQLANGKTKKMDVSQGLRQLQANDVIGFDALNRLRGMKVGRKRPIAGQEGTFQRVMPFEAAIDTMLSDVLENLAPGSVDPDPATVAAILESIGQQLDQTGLKNALDRGQRPLEGGTGGLRMSGVSDLSKMPKMLIDWRDHIVSEIEKLSGWVREAEAEIDSGQLSKAGVEGKGRKIKEWTGYINDWQTKLDEVTEIAAEVNDKPRPGGQSLRQAVLEAARARGSGLITGTKSQLSQAIVGGMVGLNPREAAYSEVGTGGSLSGQARGRLGALMKKLGEAPFEDADRSDIQDAFEKRFLETGERRLTPSGTPESSYALMKRIAFGETGRPIKRPNKNNDGGLLGELMALMPEGTPQMQRQVVSEQITDTLKGLIQDQMFRRDLVSQDMDRRENLASVRAGTTSESIRHGLTGEGQYRFAPGQDAALDVDIANQREKIAALEAQIAKGTPRKPSGVETDAARSKRLGTVRRLRGELQLAQYGGYDAENKPVTGLAQMLDQQAASRARQELEESEARGRVETRQETMAGGGRLTGADADRMAVEMGVLGATEEERRAPFADLRSLLGLDEPMVRAASGGTRGPRGRVAAGAGGAGGAGGGGEPPAGGGVEPTGEAVRVYVVGGKLDSIAGLAAAGATATAGQQGIASRSKTSWAMADLGAATSDEAIIAFDDEVKRMRRDLKLSDKAIREVAAKAGLAATAAAYFGDDKATKSTTLDKTPRVVVSPQQRLAEKQMAGTADAPFDAASRQAVMDARRRVAEQREADREKRRDDAAERRYRPLFDQAIAAEDARKARFGSLPIKFVGETGPKEFVSEEQRRAERMSTLQIDKAEQSRNRQRLAQEAADERAQKQQLREMRRQARINDPVGFGRQQDIEDERQRVLRGQLRTLNRRIPRRGFGASLTDVVTSRAPGSGALERQLEASDLAMREATEINQASTRRAQIRTQRRGLAGEIRRERAALAADPTRGAERLDTLTAQFRDLVSAGRQQSSIIRESSRRFKSFNDEATKGTTVLKSFAAAAAGSTVSIGIGALTFGLGSAVAGPLIEMTGQALQAGLERVFGEPTLIGQQRLALGESTRAAGGKADIGVATVAAQSGLAGATFERERGLLEQVAGTQAGNMALTEQFSLLKLADVSRELGGQAGVTRGLNGLFGTFFNQTPSTDESIGNFLREAGPGSVAPWDTFAGAKRDKFLGRLDSVNDIFNEFEGNLVEFGEGLQFSREELDKQVQSLRDADLNFLAEAVRSGAGAITNKETGELLTGDELRSAMEDIISGRAKPSTEATLAATEDQRRAQALLSEGMLNLRLQTTPQRQAFALSQQGFGSGGGPGRTGTSGIVFSDRDDPKFVQAINAELEVTKGLYSDVNMQVDKGVQGMRDFVASAAAGFSPAQVADFNSALNKSMAYAKDIAGIEIGLQTKQAAYAAAQFSYQIDLTRRSLKDAKELVSGVGSGLGAVQRQMYDLQRESQSLALAQSQRQINFQTAVAGFTAPGLTSEEREARIQAAKEEAKYAQRQLDIQKQLFGLSGKSFDISAARAVEDLGRQLGLLEQGRQLSIDTVVAEKKIKAITALAEAENQKVEAYYETALARTGDLLKLTVDVATATGKGVAEVSQAVINAHVKAYRTMISEIYGVTTALGGRASQDNSPDDRNALGMVSSTTQIGKYGVAGEAGGEAVAILRDPKQLVTPLGQPPGGDTYQIIVQGNSFTTQEDEDRLMTRIVKAVEDAQGRKAALTGLRPFGG